MYAAMIRAADRWRGITVGDALNQAQAERTKPLVRPVTSASPASLSSKNRT